MRRLLLLTGDSEGPVAHAPPVPLRLIFKQFWPYLRPYRKWIPVLVGLIAAGTAIAAAEIWLFKLIVDEVLVPANLGPLPLIAGAYLAFLIFGSIIAFADDYIGTWVAERFTLDLRTDTLAHLQTLSPDYIQDNRLGDLLSRLTGDIRSIETFIVGGIADGLGAILRVVVFAGALFVLQWQLAIIALVAAPLLWGATRLFMGWIKEASRERRRRSGSLTAVAEQALSNATLVTASNRQADEVGRLRAEGEAAMRAKLSSSRISGLLGPTVDLAELVGMMGIVVLGAIAVSDGSLTLGGMLAFITYLGRLFGPVREIGDLGEMAFEAAAGAERVIELLDREPEVVDRPGAVEIGRAQGAIEFSGVDFTYESRHDPALRNVDLKLDPGEMVALVGPSGAGKSTIAKLVMRFYDPDSGAVKLDGTDLRAVTLESLRRNISILLQESPILRGTVRENIAYARPSASTEEIESAARAAGAHDFIALLPDGYDTDMGERGQSLSGGQRQRIAIARALLEDAPVLILDEPTTGLDAGAREALMEPLRRLSAGRTTIVISHDPELERTADRVVRIEDGRITGAADAPPEGHRAEGNLLGAEAAHV